MGCRNCAQSWDNASNWAFSSPLCGHFVFCFAFLLKSLSGHIPQSVVCRLFCPGRNFILDQNFSEMRVNSVCEKVKNWCVITIKLSNIKTFSINSSFIGKHPLQVGWFANQTPFIPNRIIYVVVLFLIHLFFPYPLPPLPPLPLLNPNYRPCFDPSVRFQMTNNFFRSKFNLEKSPEAFLTTFPNWNVNELFSFSDWLVCNPHIWKKSINHCQNDRRHLLLASQAITACAILDPSRDVVLNFG